MLHSRKEITLMKKELLPQVKQYFKANLHAHTNISDGKLSPEELKAAYKEKGYQIVAYTDHNLCLPHPELNDGAFLALTAWEMDASESKPKGYRKTYHLNFIAKDPANRWQIYHPKNLRENQLKHESLVVCDGPEEREYSVTYINSVIARANEKGFLVTYNHPIWSLQDYTDYAELKGLWGTEVFNSECYQQGYFDNSANAYQDLLKKGNRLVPLATDDVHGLSNAFCGWVMVGAEELTYETVIAALEKGDLYATTGPDIYSVTLEDKTLTVKCSEATYINLITNGRMCQTIRAKEGPALNEAVFDLTRFFEESPEMQSENDFLRVTVIDAQGKTAYTRAFFRDELV